MRLPLLETIVQAIQPKIPKLNDTVFVCVQHLLYTSLNVFESLIFMGAVPENIFLLGKHYSTCTDVVNKARAMGIQVQKLAPLQLLGEYEVVFNREVIQLWDKVKDFIQNSPHPIERVVVLDDGGRCLRAIPEEMVKAFCVVGVEQTTAGIAQLSDLNFPTAYIDVATSTTKSLEAGMVADVIWNKISSELPASKNNPAIGVIGLGSIGTAVVKKLISLGYHMLLYDSNEVDSFSKKESVNKAIKEAFKDAGYLGYEQINWAESLDEFIQSSDYIFGCTGNDFMQSLNIKKCMKGTKHFISCSSEDREFLSILKYVRKKSFKHNYDPLRDIHWQMNKNTSIHLIKGGFPCNFDDSGTSVPAKDIQLTRALILGGLVQAIIISPSYKRNRIKGRVMLDPNMQQFIVSKWVDLHRHDKTGAFSSQNLMRFMNVTWIIKNSGGVFHYLPEFSACFEVKQGDLVTKLEIWKRLKEVFKKKRTLYRNLNDLSDFMPGYFYYKDCKGYYQDCNQAFLNLVGLKALVGKTDKELWPNTADILKKHDEEVIIQQESITVEEELVLKNGQRKIFMVIKTPWKDQNSNVIGIVAHLTDITPFRKKEGDLESIQKNSDKDSRIAVSTEDLVISAPGSLYWKNTEGVYLGCNDFMVQKAGLKARSDIVGKTDQELWPKEAEKIRENDLKVIETGKPINTEETVEGRVFFSIKNPLKDRYNHIIGVICNSHDITYLKEIEKELRVAKDQAEAANQAKSQFLATVSHELRSPITSILGMVHFLKARRKLSTKQRETYIENIDVAGKHLLSLVNDFLDFCKLEAGKFEMTVVPLDLKALMEEITTILMPQAIAKGLEFIIDYNQDIPHMVLGDPRALRQIMINLINNAIKFTEKGFIRVKVTCIEQSVEMVKLSLSVTDTGIGISKDKLAIIFDRFQQVDSSYSRRYGGTGLGLSITKKLVEMMDGTIEVTSQLNQGSTFECKIIFPQDKSIVKHPWVLHQVNVSILIVCDTHLGNILQKQLGIHHCQMITSNEALNFFIVNQQSSNFYDIVIIDDQINSQSPYELAKEINECPNLKKPMLMLLMSSPSLLLQTKAKQAGFFDCVVKPIQPLELQTSLTAAWEKWIEENQLILKNKKANTQVSLIDEHKVVERDLKNTEGIGSKKRVLLIDDEEMVRLIHREFLVELNCEVETANNAERALKMLEQTPSYDLIFADMGLPGMSGPELIKLYREREKYLNKRTPVIALTGYCSQKDKEIFLRSGVDEILVKPVSSEQLQKILQNYS